MCFRLGLFGRGCIRLECKCHFLHSPNLPRQSELPARPREGIINQRAKVPGCASTAGGNLIQVKLLDQCDSVVLIEGLRLSLADVGRTLVVTVPRNADCATGLPSAILSYYPAASKGVMGVGCCFPAGRSCREGA